jgi:hypothetical protein
VHWVDPFSSSKFTDRQNLYADHRHDSDVYTPEIIVDGKQHFVGSDNDTAVQDINTDANSSKAIVAINNIKLAGSTVTFTVDVDSSANPSPETSNLLIAITEDGLISHVTGGENRGHTLHHIAVVRDLKTVGKIGTSAGTYQVELPIGSNWNREHLNVAAFVQGNKSLVISGAAEEKV